MNTEQEQQPSLTSQLSGAPLAAIESLSVEELRSELAVERQKATVLERDLFKASTENRRLDAQIKTLQELNIANAKNRNNTSSNFTLPSEFKGLWDELVKVGILDAFPDYLNVWEEVVPLVQELFIVVREELIQIQKNCIYDIGVRLKLLSGKGEEDEQVLEHLETKFQSLFQEQSLKIFSLTDEEIQQLITQKFRPRCELVLSQSSRGQEALDDLDQNIDTPDFIRFFRAVLKLTLHMILNDPPIYMSLETFEEREKKSGLTEKYDFWMFNKNDYYCIDGFPKEGYPCVVVLPPPYRRGYVYQGIKPAVIVLEEPSEELMQYVRIRQEELLEKIKAKRQLSLGLEEDGEEKESETQLENEQSKQVNEHEMLTPPMKEKSLRKEEEEPIEECPDNEPEEVKSQIKSDRNIVILEEEKKEEAPLKDNFMSYSPQKPVQEGPEEEQLPTTLPENPTTEPDLKVEELESQKTLKALQTIPSRQSNNPGKLDFQRKNLEKGYHSKPSQLKYSKEEADESSDRLSTFEEMEKGCLSHRSIVKSPILQTKENLRTIYGEFINMKKGASLGGGVLTQSTLGLKLPSKACQLWEEEQELQQQLESGRRRFSSKMGKEDGRNMTQSQHLHKKRVEDSRNEKVVGEEKSQVQSQQALIKDQIKQLSASLKNTKALSKGSTCLSMNKNHQQEHQNGGKEPVMISKFQNNSKDGGKYGTIVGKVYGQEKKYYEMPKKFNEGSSQTKKTVYGLSGKCGQGLAFSKGNSVISEMHLQRENHLITEDFQRKIQQYQQMMKKHQFCERKQLVTMTQETSFGSSSSSSFIQPPNKAVPNQHQIGFNKSRFGTLEQSGIQPNQSMRSTKEEESKKDERKPSQSKKENLLHLKSKYFSKLTELNQEMLEEKAKALEQHKRNSLKARSPFDPNMPRQQEDSKNLPNKGLPFDSSDSDEEEYRKQKNNENSIRRERLENGEYKKVTQSINDYKRLTSYRKDGSQSSLGRGGEYQSKGFQAQNYINTLIEKRSSSRTLKEQKNLCNQEQNAVHSPKVCVSYRGQFGNGSASTLMRKNNYAGLFAGNKAEGQTYNSKIRY